LKQPVVENLLVRSGVLDSEGLARALEAQAQAGGSLARAAAGLGLCEESAAARAIAKGLGLDFVDLTGTAAADLPDLHLPPDFCRTRLVVPVKLIDRSLRLAMANPLDQSTVQDVEFRTSKWVIPMVAAESDILNTLKRLHPDLDKRDLSETQIAAMRPEGEVEATEADYEVVDPRRLAKEVKLPPIVRLVNTMLADAAKAGASDVHIEAQEQGLLVRHRVDGILQDVLKIPKDLQHSTISRLKIISGMDIAERRKSQDGRCRLRMEDRKIDLRVSTLPTNFGEKVVVRLLDQSGALIELGHLGFSAAHLATFRELLGRPQGMVLVTGPTGSGKTSTLYAALNEVKSQTKNIITVEDPIEYQLPGVNQVQINTKGGVTFAAGLRSILRQDPNIILLGEIRDAETAGIALEAAQTGHLMLSTLHTNDAPSSITRLIDLGIEPFMVAASVAGVLAQRLVRRPCARCLVDRPPSEETLARLPEPLRPQSGARFVTGVGCEECRQSGYRGRLAIHELLMVTDEVRARISRRAPEHEIREAARRSGMRTLLEDGLEKASQGLTTLEEVLRVAPPDEAHRSTAPAMHAPVASPTGAQSARDHATGGAGVGPEGRQRRILVVEDSPTVVTVVRYFLELEGFEVLVAEDGLTGLDIARRELPDLVVSDLNMPGMDGLTMTEELRKDPRTRDMAIVMLTSEASVESETKGLEVGVDDYLPKPVEPRRLAARIAALLARRGGGLRAASA
jgi:type IV pilus assembly protein PilB